MAEKVRMMIRADVPKILNMECAIFKNKALSLKELVDFVESPDCRCYVVVSGDILGYLIFTDTHDVAEIERLVVAYNYRRLGIATLLLRKIRQKSVFFVPDDKKEAHLCLKKNGFVAKAIKIGYFDDKSDAYVFTREI